MSVFSMRTWPVRGLTLAVALVVAACASAPTATRSGTKAVRKPTGVSATKAVAGSSAPKAVPSLGLLLEGRVTIDPTALINSKMAQPTANGVKLISDNGLGLISDNGLGLISDNGLGLISDNGLGLIANAGAGLVSNNSAGFRIQQAGGTSGGLKPVEGMVVTAVNLFTGKVIAGPVPTDAQGGYKLGFLKAPDKNIGIVAGVHAKAPVARFTYATLVAPEAKPVVTSDTTRALTRYLLGVIPGRIQPYIDGVKAGTPAEVEPDDDVYARQIKALIAKIPAEKMQAADRFPDGSAGAVALNISQRILSYVDLTTPTYQTFYAVTEEARAFGESIQPQPDVPLVEQVMKLASDRVTARQLPELFKQYGMPADRADQLAADMNEKAVVIGQELLLVMIAHQKEVFAPLEELAKP